MASAMLIAPFSQISDVLVIVDNPGWTDYLEMHRFV
jgi:hypothetical protein